MDEREGDGNRKDRRLRLIRGGVGGEARVCGVELHLAPGDRPPFPVDARVVEDDTYFVLGADPDVREPTEHPLRLWRKVREAEPAQPGTVVLKRGRPPRLHAVVHELSRDPTWDERWIADALDGVLARIGPLGVESLGLPPLGSVHGRLEPARFLALLREALGGGRPPRLRRIWIARPRRPGDGRRWADALREAADP